MTEEMHPDAKYTNKQISLCIPLHHLKEVVMEERLNHTVSSIANGTSCLILAWHLAFSVKHLWHVCARKGKESNFSSHLSWVSDGPVTMFCSRRVNENERATSGRATQIMLCWFCCIAGLWLVDCHAPWHILSASHTQDFTICFFLFFSRQMTE